MDLFAQQAQKRQAQPVRPHTQVGLTKHGWRSFACPPQIDWHPTLYGERVNCILTQAQVEVEPLLPIRALGDKASVGLSGYGQRVGGEGRLNLRSCGGALHLRLRGHVSAHLCVGPQQRA